MRRPQLQSTLARAVVPVAAGIGFFALVGLLLWGVAAVVSRNSDEATDNLAPAFQEMGRAQFVADLITEDGPIILQDLVGDDRNIVLDYTPAGGFQIYLAHPADRTAACQIEQQRGTREFTDCEGRTLDPEDLAPPPKGVKPTLSNDRTILTLDLTADVVATTTTVAATP